MATDEERLVVTLEARVRDFERNFARAQQTSDRRLSAIEARARTSATRLASTFDRMGTAAGTSMMALGTRLGVGLAGVFSAREIGQAAAQYTNLQNALKVTGLQGEALTGTFNTLFQIAQRNGTAIGPLVTLYARLSQTQKELGATSEELTTFTDGIALALRVGGTTAEAASGSLMQLSQALGGAVVRAEEFNSMLEGTPTIVQTAARGLQEAGGSVARLRSLVVDGKVSSEAFFRAFLAGMSGLAEQASRTSGTVSQGMGRVSNALILLAGKLDETTGASASAATNLNAVADAIQGIPRYIDAAVSGLSTLHSWLAKVGNNPIWRRIGEALGGDYSPEAMAAAGIYNPAERKRRAGSGRRGGATMASASSETVSIEDYKADDGKEKKARKERADEYENLTRLIGKRTGAIEAETAAQAGLNPLINDYGFAVEKARAEYDLLTAAQEAGRDITPELRQQIDTLATAYANASVASEQLRESQGRLQETMADYNAIGREAIGSFVSDLRRGVDAADALSSALDRVIDRLLDMTLDNLFNPAGSGSGGLIGGLLSSFFGGGKADGGPISAGKGYVVGERGPEFIVPRASGFVIPNHALGGGGATSPVSVTINTLPGETGDVSRRADGGVQIDMRRLVRGEMVGAIRDGALDEPLRQRFPSVKRHIP